jgi:hypothetical protein
VRTWQPWRRRPPESLTRAPVRSRSRRWSRCGVADRPAIRRAVLGASETRFPSPRVVC